MDRIGDALHQLVPRISRLDIYWDAVDVGQLTLNSFLAKYVGNKEFCSLVSLSITELEHVDSGETSFILNTPNLRKLQFSGDFSDFPRVNVENMVALRYDWSDWISHSLLEALSPLHRLEHITLENGSLDLEPDDDDYREDHPIVTLGKLSSLSVGPLFAPDMVHLLNHLVMPSSANISLLVQEGSSGSASIDKLLYSQIPGSIGLRIVQMPKNIDYTITRPSGGWVWLRHVCRSLPSRVASLSQLASVSNDITFVDLDLKVLPSMQELNQALYAWSQITHICVCTMEDEFERLLTALEEGPEIPCPRLQTLDCSATRFSSLRMKYFLDFREGNGVALKEIKIAQGRDDIFGENMIVSSVTKVTEVDSEMLHRMKCLDNRSRMPKWCENDVSFLN